MKITVVSTEKLVTVNGIPARVWEGKTASGIAVHCYITLIAVRSDDDNTEFERELMEYRQPSAEVLALPSRLTIV